MKALTLLQPWASLVATGAKTIETRSWDTSYRGPLAIHASKGLPLVWKPFTGLFVEALGDACGVNEFGVLNLRALPVGVILATCTLADVIATDVSDGTGKVSEHVHHDHDQIVREMAFGDFGAGRYAWLLTDVRLLPEPVPARGRLRLWNIDLETEAL